MSRIITRSMTATGRGARHHILAIPAEVRSIILSMLFDCSPLIKINGDRTCKNTYFHVPLEIFWICRTLRAEAMPHFGMAPGSRLVIWLDTTFGCLTRSVPPGLLDHLQRITIVDAPTTESLDTLAQLPRLHTVIWKACVTTCDELELPHSIDQNGRTKALDEFLMTLLELDYERIFRSNALCKISGEKKRLRDLLQERYINLRTNLRLVLRLEIFLDVVHPKAGFGGWLGLVSDSTDKFRCLELICTRTGCRDRLSLLEDWPHEGVFVLRERRRCCEFRKGDWQEYPVGW